MSRHRGGAGGPQNDTTCHEGGGQKSAQKVSRII